jgi:hypothetical protein
VATLEQLHRAEMLAHRQYAFARAARLRAEADDLIERTPETHAAYDAAYSAERRIRGAWDRARRERAAADTAAHEGQLPEAVG